MIYYLYSLDLILDGLLLAGTVEPMSFLSLSLKRLSLVLSVVDPMRRILQLSTPTLIIILIWLFHWFSTFIRFGSRSTLLESLYLCTWCLAICSNLWSYTRSDASHSKDIIKRASKSDLTIFRRVGCAIFLDLSISLALSIEKRTRPVWGR